MLSARLIGDYQGMGSKPCTFKQRDVTALMKAARRAGCEVARVELCPDGKILLFTGGKAPEAEATLAPVNEWDGAVD